MKEQLDWLHYAIDPSHPKNFDLGPHTGVLDCDAQALALEAIGNRDPSIEDIVDAYCDQRYIYGEQRHNVWARVYDHWVDLAEFLELF
jgi:hypothetical protein